MDPARRIGFQVEGGKIFASQDRGKVFAVDVAPEFPGQEPRVENEGIIVDLIGKIIGVQSVPVNKDHVARVGFHLLVGSIHFQNPAIYIVQLDPVVPMPGNVIACEEPALVIITHKRKSAGILSQKLLAVVLQSQIFFHVTDHVRPLLCRSPSTLSFAVCCHNFSHKAD